MKGGVSMEYTLNMIFIAADKNKVSISVEGIRPTLPKPQIVKLMDTLIEKNIFLTKHGELTAKHSAQIITRNVANFVLS